MGEPPTVSEFGNKYGDQVFDMDEGVENLISRLDSLLERLDPERSARLRTGYSDVYKNIRFSSEENKWFLFEDLVQAIDLSTPAGWSFGPEEEFSAVYRFCNES